MKRYILLAILLGGCASAPLTEQEQHDLDDKRLIQRDELIQFLNYCELHPEFALVEYSHGRSLLPNDREKRKSIADIGVPYTHDNVHQRARIQYFACARPEVILRELGL